MSPHSAMFLAWLCYNTLLETIKDDFKYRLCRFAHAQSVSSRTWSLGGRRVSSCLKSVISSVVMPGNTSRSVTADVSMAVWRHFLFYNFLTVFLPVWRYFLFYNFLTIFLPVWRHFLFYNFLTVFLPVWRHFLFYNFLTGFLPVWRHFLFYNVLTVCLPVWRRFFLSVSHSKVFLTCKSVVILLHNLSEATSQVSLWSKPYECHHERKFILFVVCPASFIGIFYDIECANSSSIFLTI